MLKTRNVVLGFAKQDITAHSLSIPTLTRPDFLHPLLLMDVASIDTPRLSAMLNIEEGRFPAMAYRETRRNFLFSSFAIIKNPKNKKTDVT